MIKRNWKDALPDAREAVRHMDEFDAAKIGSALGVGEWSSAAILKSLLDEGTVVLHRRDGRKRWYTTPGRLSEMAAAAAPAMPTASAEGNMWRAMRGLDHFSALDVAAHATAGGIEVDTGQAQSYATALLKAGYLAVHRRADPSKSRPARYRLIENTGPSAPLPRRVRGLWDPNEERFHLLSEAPR